jgi:hypothetical protein
MFDVRLYKCVSFVDTGVVNVLVVEGFGIEIV